MTIPFDKDVPHIRMGEGQRDQDAITLRDYAALQLMGRMLPLYTRTKYDPDGSVMVFESPDGSGPRYATKTDAEALVREALRIADAYLKERAK